MRRIGTVLTVLTLLTAGMMGTGCSSVAYGPLTVRSLGTDVNVESAAWVKKYPDGTTEALTIAGGKRNSSESVHTVGNFAMTALGMVIGSAGGPVGTAVGGASGLGLGEIYQTLKDVLNKAPDTPQTTTPQQDVVVTPTPGESAVLNDDPDCELVVKRGGNDWHNDGQVTYVKRLVTSIPKDGANPVAVQYNDTSKGEVTVWKDQSHKGQAVDKLPTDCGISKLVVWYE